MNIPLRYLALTLGLYATCIEGAVNFAPSLYGFYRNHLSWEWMFWTSALVAPRHGGVRLLRHSGVFAAEAIGTGTELRRISVRQRRPRAAVRRARPGTAARLVALRRVHGAVHDRDLLPPVRVDSPSAPAESIGGSAVPPQMEHARPRDSVSSRSVSACSRRPWSSRRRWPCADSTRLKSVRPCCGRPFRSCVSRSSRPTC